MKNQKKYIKLISLAKAKKIAVVIPFHKASLSEEEKISLKHLTRYLGKYDKFLGLPKSIKKVSFRIPKVKIINFPNEYFTSVPKYCEMLNTREFYEKFTNYEYILIYQLDVLVFSDKLSYFCNKKFDYVGPPFFNPLIGKLSFKPGSPISGGNGGFSLRNVKSFLRIIDIAEKISKRTSNNFYKRRLWFLMAVLQNRSHKIWLNAPPYDYPFNEDGFWSYEAPKYYTKFKVAPFKEALKFGFERYPRKCFELNGNKLPFGCHAFSKYDKEFWDQFILR